MTSSRGSINAEPTTITTDSDTERRLAERAAITAMSRSRSQGTEVTIVTGAFPFELPRDITENFSVMGTPSLQPFLKTYWPTPVQMTGQLSRSMQIRAREAV